MTTSPHLRPVHLNKHSLQMTDAKMGNLMDCLESFERYTNDESEIIDVLLQTLNSPNNDVFDCMVNWHDLYKNIKQRKREWIQFEQQFNSCIILKEYDEKKHEEIKTYIAKKIKTKTPKTPQSRTLSLNKESMLQKALKFEYDRKKFNLLNKKDKLLTTASTYSILKNNKEKTDKLISKCNDKMDEINKKIAALQNEKKQYFSALMRTKNKLLFQIQSIRETETAIKELHEETSKIQTEMDSIEKTKDCVDKFEDGLSGITRLMHSNFNQRLEATWHGWNNEEVAIWIQNIENERFRKMDLSHIRQSGLCGKDLPEMNDFILRSFKIQHKNDREILLKNIQRIIQLKPSKQRMIQTKQMNDGHNAKKKKVVKKGKRKSHMCVICNENEANYIAIPCGHIAVCPKCVELVKKQNKCAFCGQKITNIIKCFHVGVGL